MVNEIKFIQICKSQITTLYLRWVEAHSLLSITWFKGSVMIWPKVIPLSGVHCFCCLFYFVLFMKKSWFYLCVVCWMQIQCYYELLLFINSCEISNFSSFVLLYYFFKLEPLRPYAMLLNILYSWVHSWGLCKNTKCRPFTLGRWRKTRRVRFYCTTYGCY